MRLYYRANVTAHVQEYAKSILQERSKLLDASGICYTLLSTYGLQQQWLVIDEKSSTSKKCKR